jgi:hypothetical protein
MYYREGESLDVGTEKYENFRCEDHHQEGDA